jgi:ribose transport system permease protein
MLETRTETMKKSGAFPKLGQDMVVLIISAILFLIFSITLNGFFSTDNLLSLLRNVSILGILGLGMAVVVIARGINLAIVAIMAMSVAWVLVLGGDGMSIGSALALGFGFVVLIGLITGVLIAYVEVPPLFATLAMTSSIYGFGRLALVESDSNYLPQNADILRTLGGGMLLGIPMPVVLFGVFALLGWFFLNRTKLGRFTYAVGDNPAAARIAGIKVRPMTVGLYILSSVVAFAAGLITAGVVGEMHTRLSSSTMIYDVILVVAIGGISLSGGKGSIRSVLVGTLLIGILLNGMTILNISYTQQSILKGVILLLAILTDAILNPRDEQTSQQGDI